MILFPSKYLGDMEQFHNFANGYPCSVGFADRPLTAVNIRNLDSQRPLRGISVY